MSSHLIRLALLCAPVVLHAGVFYQTSYTIDLTSFPAQVTNLLAEENPGAPYAQRMNYLGPSSGIAGANAVTTLDQPFLNGSGIPNSVSLLMGIAQDLPGDAPGQKHIVLFMDPSVAALTPGIAWGAFFPTVDEDQLIADLELGTSGGLNWGNDFLTLAPGLANAAAFMNSLYTPGGLMGPGGTLYSPYFDLPVPGAAATDFVAVAFSDGQIVGSGSVVQNAISFTTTPEPSTLAGCILFAAFALFRFRRAHTA